MTSCVRIIAEKKRSHTKDGKGVQEDERAKQKGEEKGIFTWGYSPEVKVAMETTPRRLSIPYLEEMGGAER